MARPVFILNRDEFYVDEEPLDPQVGRLVMLFKNNGIQSISIEPGLEKTGDQGVPGGVNQQKRRRGIQKGHSWGVSSIKVNHVRYKKVTDDDEVISLKDLTPQMMAAEDEAEDPQDVHGHAAGEARAHEEFAKTLNIESLMARGRVQET